MPFDLVRTLLAPAALAALAPAALAAAITASAWSEDAPVYSPAQLRSDFDALYETMQSAHYDLFAATPRSVMDQRHAEMMRELDRPMRREEAAVYFQTFLAEARHAHARIDFPFELWSEWRESGGGGLLVDIRIRDGRGWVENHQTGHPALRRGDEILALNGEPNAIWLNRFTRHLSAETPTMAYALLESYLPLVFWLEYPAAQNASLTVRHTDGSVEHLQLPLLSRADMENVPASNSPAFNLPEFDARMLDGGIGYLRPGPFYNTEPGGNPWDPASYVARIDTAFQTMIEADAQALIIDVRDNPGGSNSFSDPIIAWFADRPWTFASDFRIRISEETTASSAARLASMPEGEGGVDAQYAGLFATAENGEIVSFDLPVAQPRDGAQFNRPVYLLVNRYSYSNAVSVGAILQDYGFGTVAGETTSDMATTYGAMETFSLPATGITVGYPKAHIIRPNGDARPHPLTPDLRLDFPALRGPEDVVLEQLRGHIAESLNR